MNNDILFTIQFVLFISIHYLATLRFMELYSTNHQARMNEVNEWRMNGGLGWAD